MHKKLFLFFVIGLVLCFVPIKAVKAEDPNLVGWWMLDEISGMIAADSSGNGNDGTLQGDPQWITGQINGALELDGNGDFVELPIGSLISTLTDSTFAIWVNWAGGGNYQRIFDFGTGMGVNIWLTPNDGGGMRFAITTAGSGAEERINTQSALESDWHHIAVTMDSQNGSHRLYIDGQEAAQNLNATLTMSDLGNTNNNWLGQSQYADPDFNGSLDDFYIYNRVLSQDEIQTLMEGGGLEARGAVFDPNPADEETDVIRDVYLSWKPGGYPGTHNIYFGTDFNDVNDSTALMSENQDANTYDPGRLELGTTYYWRIDEVNDSADATVHRGSIWSFTTESYAYKIPSSSITASASSQESEESGPENTINESGLDPNAMDLHSILSVDMWLTDDANAAEPAWIQYDFDKAYKLHQMLVWNYNGESILWGFGIKDVNIEYSEDDETWNQLSSATQFERAPSTAGYKYNTIVDFGNIPVKSVRIKALTKWGGIIYPQYGLSEVRFMYIPVHAREPYPDMDEEDVPIDVTLSWREGREAGQHIVSYSTDQQAVSEGNAVATTVEEASHGPLSLDIANVYYWRINEVNDTATPTTWIGDIWSFKTQDYIVVEDFESYTDEELNRIWDVWADGWDDDNNGSTIGYPDPDFDAGEHFVETDIVHGGEQSGPLIYDNTSADYSEVSVDTADLPIGTDNWTAGSPEAFVIWFLGDPNNEPTDQLYVKLNDTKKVYPGDVADIARTVWTKFEVSLAGMDISDISSLKIGVEKVGATGGDGILFLDDIQLTFFVTAIDPGTDNLIANYDMENNVLDSSGSGFDGTLYGGDPNYVTGKYGMALELDGEDDYVELPIGETISTLESCTISSWVNWSGSGGGDQWERVFDFGSGTTDNLYLTTRSSFTTMRSAIKAGDGAEDQATASPRLSTGNWEHLAVVIDAANMTMTLYRNGDAVADTSLQYLPKDMGVTTQNWLGRSQWADPYFGGMLDDFRIYNKALSDGEIKYIYEN